MSFTTWVDARLDRQRTQLVAELKQYADDKVTELRTEVATDIGALPGQFEKLLTDMLPAALRDIIPHLPFIGTAPLPPQKYKPGEPPK